MRDNSMGPVFLLAGGGRTGSTLIQRLIISSGEIMLWGEHGGIILPQLRKLFNQLNAWCDKANSQTHLSDFRASSHAAWMPNINPEPPFMLAGCRAFLEQSLGVAARNMGYKRWGFKEIRYGAEEVRMLQALFPRACFIFLVRNPVSCLKSIKATQWYESDYQSDPVRFLADWSRVSGSLRSIQPACTRSCLVRYEDAISSPAATAEKIAETIGVPVDHLDLSVFEQKRRGKAAEPAMLDEQDQRALQDPVVLEISEKLGYLPFEQSGQN